MQQKGKLQPLLPDGACCPQTGSFGTQQNRLLIGTQQDRLLTFVYVCGGYDTIWTMNHKHAVHGPSQKTFAGPETDHGELPRCSYSKLRGMEENTDAELKNTWECHLLRQRSEEAWLRRNRDVSDTWRVGMRTCLQQ